MVKIVDTVGFTVQRARFLNRQIHSFSSRHEDNKKADLTVRYGTTNTSG
jgi:hypothetical protein